MSACRPPRTGARCTQAKREREGEKPAVVSKGDRTPSGKESHLIEALLREIATRSLHANRERGTISARRRGRHAGQRGANRNAVRQMYLAMIIVFRTVRVHVSLAPS